ncbi:MAG: OmpA family protein [Vicinamibacterales bacterium]
MKRLLLGLTAVTVAFGSSTACATKKYVNTQVADVNNKVGALSTAVEETQQRTRENAQKIGEVDQKVGRVEEKTVTAQRAADDAKMAASKVDSKVDAVEASSRKLIFEAVLKMDDSKGGNFDFGKANLPDDAKTELDKLIAEVTADPRNYYFEIEGHTDDRGDVKTNERIGLERAEAVKRYLYEAHRIPLHKMSVITYGESKPIGDNKTKDGRAQNRRVLVRIMA